MDIWSIWLAVFLSTFLLALAYRWTIAPLVIARKQTAPRVQQRLPTRPEQMTPEMQAYFGGLIGQFRAEGFDVAANIYSPGVIAGFDAFELMLVRRDRGDLAHVIAALSSTRRVFAFEIDTTLADGQRWKTGASTTPPIFPPVPGERGIACDWVRTVGPLYEFHRRRLADAGHGNAIGLTPAAGEEITYLAAEEQKLHEWHARCGYRKLNAATDRWRFTIKGAYLAVWKLREPIKGWRQRHRERAARREWERLGMPSWQSPVVPAMPVDDALADELPVAVADSQETAAAPLLQYNAAAEPGKITFATRDGVLTVMLGRGTLGEFLKRNWYMLFALLVAGGFTVHWLYLLWSIHQRYRMSMSDLIGRFWTTFALLGGLLALRVYRATKRHRGAVTLRASHAGLEYENVPARPNRGAIDRADISAIEIAISEFGLMRRTHRLVARVHGRRKPITLVRGLPKSDLQTISDRLQVAMGLRHAGAVPAAISTGRPDFPAPGMAGRG